ncbi:hypothetical protein [Mesorhizobium sp. WSM2239]|uniref:Uncharacterized protein n=2 Tax=unclassified Mesorhizobium TaxID=325217 RepID=A0AAU8DL33_9HYPH
MAVIAQSFRRRTSNLQISDYSARSFVSLAAEADFIRITVVEAPHLTGGNIRRNPVNQDDSSGGMLNG